MSMTSCFQKYPRHRVTDCGRLVEKSISEQKLKLDFKMSRRLSIKTAVPALALAGSFFGNTAALRLRPIRGGGDKNANKAAKSEMGLSLLENAAESAAGTTEEQLENAPIIVGTGSDRMLGSGATASLPFPLPRDGAASAAAPSSTAATAAAAHDVSDPATAVEGVDDEDASLALALKLQAEIDAEQAEIDATLARATQAAENAQAHPLAQRGRRKSGSNVVGPVETAGAGASSTARPQQSSSAPSSMSSSPPGSSWMAGIGAKLSSGNLFGASGGQQNKQTYRAGQIVIGGANGEYGRMSDSNAVISPLRIDAINSPMNAGAISRMAAQAQNQRPEQGVSPLIQPVAPAAVTAMPLASAQPQGQPRVNAQVVAAPRAAPAAEAQVADEERLLEDVVDQIKTMGFDDEKVRAAVTEVMFDSNVPTSTYELLLNAGLDKVMSEPAQTEAAPAPATASAAEAAIPAAVPVDESLISIDMELPTVQPTTAAEAELSAVFDNDVSSQGQMMLQQPAGLLAQQPQPQAVPVANARQQFMAQQDYEAANAAADVQGSLMATTSLIPLQLSAQPRQQQVQRTVSSVSQFSGAGGVSEVMPMPTATAGPVSASRTNPFVAPVADLD